MYLQEPSTPLNINSNYKKSKRSKKALDLAAEFAAYDSYFDQEKGDDHQTSASGSTDLQSPDGQSAFERIEAWLSAKCIFVENPEIKKYNYYAAKQYQVQLTLASQLSCCSSSSSLWDDFGSPVSGPQRSRLSSRLNLGLEISSPMSVATPRLHREAEGFLAPTSPELAPKNDCDKMSLPRRKALSDSKNFL